MCEIKIPPPYPHRCNTLFHNALRNGCGVIIGVKKWNKKSVSKHFLSTKWAQNRITDVPKTGEPTKEKQYYSHDGHRAHPRTKMRVLMVLNCFCTPLSSVTLIPKRVGTIGNEDKFHPLHWSLYSCGSSNAQR